MNKNITYMLLLSFSLLSCGGGEAQTDPGTQGGSDTPSDTGSPTPGTINLNWTIPATRKSGAPISMGELNGYHIYYGTTSNNLNNSIDVSDAYTTSYSITNLVQGTTYHVQITAYDTANVESDRSNLVSKPAS